ncbi:MAG: 4-alpha-glucanotransferase [bacterium]|nr:4-alpha-glucanotransferase [bacterium]
MGFSGILLHISSLPSKYGIGTLGKEAYKFVDFLCKSGQKYWQVLPLGPTGFGDSPYQSFSCFAGNEYFIDLDTLCDEGLLSETDLHELEPHCNDFVDYGWVYDTRFKILEKAYNNFKNRIPDDYISFCDQNRHWLDDYAAFMAFKNHFEGKAWSCWETAIKFRNKYAFNKLKSELHDKIEFFKVVQYLFYKQWFSLKRYANFNGIQIIGDLPIYAAFDSADVWANPTQFLLDDNLMPQSVAGCPPDCFSEDGQVWGNPLYDWKHMKNDRYCWWITRMKHSCELFDIIRIDHFRGFDEYYSIPFGDTTAANGRWESGPGMDLFDEINRRLNPKIIAEDLGIITQSVRQLLQSTGFPGMKVLQFAFESDQNNPYLPHNYPENCVAYTGTHDNDTILGWFDSAQPEQALFAIQYLGLTKQEGYNWGMMRAVWNSPADTVIVTMQDLLSLTNEARMNLPSTLGDNWKWRMTADQISPSLANKLNTLMRRYNRIE